MHEATQAQKDRAPRYRLTLPVRFRCEGDQQWHEGKTENISSTGVLFCAPKQIAVQQSIEITVVLNIEFGTMAMGEIQCVGQVVRAEQRECDGQNLAIAAVLSNHAFLAPGGNA